MWGHKKTYISTAPAVFFLLFAALKKKGIFRKRWTRYANHVAGKRKIKARRKVLATFTQGTCGHEVNASRKNNATGL